MLTNNIKSYLDPSDYNVQMCAEWIFNNMTDKNKKFLLNMMNVCRAKKTWLTEEAAYVFSFIVDERISALEHAILSGQCKALKRPPIHTMEDCKVIGVVICELLQSKELDGTYYLAGDERRKDIERQDRGGPILFSTLIKTTRKQRGIKMVNVARATGISSRYLYDIESGLHNPSFTVRQKILNYYNLSEKDVL